MGNNLGTVRLEIDDKAAKEKKEKGESTTPSLKI
jgi:hypothetical protein